MFSMLLVALPALAQKPVWQQTNASAENYLANRRALTGRHCMVNKLINSVGVATWIDDLGNLVDEDLNNYATFPKIVDATVAVNPITSIRDTKNHYAGGTTAGFTLVAGTNSSLLSLDIIKAFAISFYNEGELIGTVAVESGANIGGVGLSLITIPGSSEVNIDVSATAPGEFDEITLMPSGGVDLSAITDTKIKYAFVGDYVTNTITQTSMQNYATSHGRDAFSLDQGEKQREGAQGTAAVTQTELGYWAGSDLINDNLTDGVAWGVIGIGANLDVRVGAAPNRQDADQSMPFKKGSIVGFKYGNGSVLDLSVGKSVDIYLYKGEWKEVDDTYWGTPYTYYEYQQTEVQHETVSVTVLGLNLIKGGDQFVSITANDDFSHARIVFPTGLSINLGGTKAYYAYVCDPAEAVHQCDIKISASTAICDSESQYQLAVEGDIPVTWSIESQAGPASIDENNVLTMGAVGEYVIRATAADGCFAETVITRGLEFEENECDVPVINIPDEQPQYELSQSINSCGSLISISGYLVDAENVLSPSLEDYATFSQVLNVNVAEDKAIVGVKKKSGTFSNGSKHRIGFMVETRSAGLTAEVLDLFRIVTYNNGVETYNSLVNENNAVKVKLIGSNKVQKMTLAITVPDDIAFNEFVLWKTGVLKLNIDRFNIYYAFDESVQGDQETSPCDDPLACSTTLVSPNTGATLNHDELQFAGAVNVANVIDNLSYLIDDDVTTGVGITNTVSLGQGTVLAVDLGRVYDPTHQVGIIVDKATYLAGVEAGGWLTLKTYLDGVETGDVQNDWSVLGLNAIGYGDKSYLFMNPTQPYDEVRVTIASIANLLSVNQLYYGIYIRNDYDHDGIPDCRDDDSCADELTLDEEATVLSKGRDYELGNLVLHRTLSKEKWNCLVLPVNLNWLQLRNAFGNDVQIATPTELVENNNKNRSILMYNPVTVNDDEDVIIAGQYYLIKPYRDPDLDKTMTYTALDGTVLNGPIYFIPKVNYVQSIAEAPVATAKIMSSQANGAPARVLGKATTNEHKVVLHGSNVYLDGETNAKVAAGNYLFDDNGDLWAKESDEPMLGFRYYIENKTDKILTYDPDGDGVVTGITEVNMDGSQAKKGIYTLDGRRVVGVTNADELPMGIYIVDGVKVVVTKK